MPAQSLRPAHSIEADRHQRSLGDIVEHSFRSKARRPDNVTRVTWSVDWGGSGTASGTREWTVPTVGLQIGRNVITVTAMTADGRVDRQSVTVTYQPLRASRIAAILRGALAQAAARPRQLQVAAMPALHA
jgi:hypothetical protein